MISRCLVTPWQRQLRDGRTTFEALAYQINAAECVHTRLLIQQQESSDIVKIISKSKLSETPKLSLMSLKALS